MRFCRVELLTDVIDEIYEDFLISAVLAGKVAVPDFWERKDAYFAHKWVKPPKPWIDPAKEAAAVQTALQTGQKTFKQVAAENGADWRDQIDDIAEVLQYARDTYELDLGGMIFGNAAQSVPASGGGEDDESSASGYDHTGHPGKGGRGTNGNPLLFQ